jgi:CDP-paratose 2-epimerase
MAMSVAIITGSAGLIGSEAAAFFAARGLQVVGIDNDLRRELFGAEGTTRANLRLLTAAVPAYEHHHVDIRDQAAIFDIFRRFRGSISLVIHAAAQPSHDWAAEAPFVDFTVNANGTLVLLEAVRQFAPDAVFIFTSTNKVYGDRPNQLPFVELETRWEIEPAHPYADGIPEDVPVDRSLHSLFGVSKLAADALVQEYGRYFGLRTACFRAGCVTGPNHAGVELHGFLSYLMRCVLTGVPYTIFGYKGKQVRDNIHSADLIRAFDCFLRAPRCGEVYNIGGGRYSNCSLLEAIRLAQELTGRELVWSYREQSRAGDHIWWLSSLARFQEHYPSWSLEYDVPGILAELAEAGRERWLDKASAPR